MADTHDGLLGLFYKAAVAILHGFRGDPFTAEAAESLQKAELSDAKDLLLEHKGFSAPVAVSILYIVIMPIFGLILLCKLCCCKKKGNKGGGTIATAVMGSLCLAFLIAGMTMFGMNTMEAFEQIQQVRDTMDTQLSSLRDYVKDTEGDILRETQTALKNVKETKLVEETIRDLEDDITAKIPSDKVKLIDTNLGDLADLIDETVTLIETDVPDGFSSVRAQSLNYLTSLKNKVAFWKDSSIKDYDFVEAKKEIKDDLDTKSGTLSNVASGLTSIAENIRQNAAAANLTGQIDNVETELAQKANESIATAQERLDDIVDDVNATMKNAETDVQEKVDDIVYKIDDIREDLREAISNNTADVMDHKLHALLGALFPLLLVAAPFAVGLLLGITVGGVSVSRRGGRCCLCTSSVFIFITASQLMILAMLAFSVSYLAENALCDPLMRSEQSENEMLARIDKRLGSLAPNVSISGIVQGCRSDLSIVEAANMQELTDFDLDTITQDIDNISITELDDMQAEISSVVDQIEANLTDTQYNLNQVKAFLKPAKSNLDTAYDVPLAHLEDIAQFLNDYINTNWDSADAAVEKTAVTTLIGSIDVNYMENIKPAANKTNTAQSITDETNSTLDAVSETLGTLDIEIEAAINEYVELMKQRAKDLVTTELDRLTSATGRCRPLYDIYAAIVHDLLCRQLLYPLHGVWFSLGICLTFYIPTALVANSMFAKLKPQQRVKPQ